MPGRPSSSSSAPGTVLTGMAKRTVQGASHDLGLRARRPRHAPRPPSPDRRAASAGVHEGEHLFATERLVVSPGAGVFTPDARRRRRHGRRAGHRARHGGRPRGPLALRRRPSWACWPSTASGSPRASRSPGCGPHEHDGGSPQPHAGRGITGWGTALPEKIVTNDDLAARLDTSDDWIRERTGIEERRHRRLDGDARHRGRPRSPSTPPGSPATTSTRAARHHDARRPGARHRLRGPGRPRPRRRRDRPQRRLLRLRLRARPRARPHRASACSGSCSSASETLSRIVDWTDRNTAILFGDGAGAVVLEAVDGEGRAARLGPRLRRPTPPPARSPIRRHTCRWTAARSSARRSASWSTRRTPRSTTAGVTADDIALVVPHQANIRIIEAACSRLGIPTERVANVLQPTGNTSSASIPLALATPSTHGRVAAGDLVLLSRLRRRHDLGVGAAAMDDRGPGPRGEPA